MKLALVYDRDDHKLQDTSYSWTYKGMMDALANRFEDVVHVHDDCNAMDIDADLIMFYDVHATHHIRMDGIRSHPAMKMEYVSDPNQEAMRGVFRQFNRKIQKLGRRERVDRFFERGIRYIVCPYSEGYYQWLGEFLGSDAENMLLWFPIAPAINTDLTSVPLAERKQAVLGNGAILDQGKRIYEFRRWAFKHDFISLVDHWVQNKKTPSGQDYVDFVAGYAGALALHDYFPVPKYFEMPYAGCVTFAQYYEEYEALGFKDFETCVYVNYDNFEKRVKDFLNDISSYQKIADAGRKLVEDKYTAKHFADFIYNTVKDGYV